MNKRLLRFVIWSSVSLAVLFQAAFLVELHSPLPPEVPLWSLSILSLACVGVVLLARGSVATTAKISYASERVYLQHHSDAGVGYRAQGAYCVILCRQHLSPVHYPRTKCFYLCEASADRAVATASVENPQWRAIGIEPSNLSARMPQRDGSLSTSHTWHVA
ncbi:MAG: hypothetical protein QOJ51_6392 [Acidobacteriaceae bacterium]|jgi:hypothetical protein|nr:hypothetical protein [Acidobacteriaceae bacterium]MDX6456949.1 hypothetical protein [Acidobacteriaceae bacterium]MEA2263567.1 hypothetical protein [Acidobacteriaceae bacterium]MEA3007059.1 hypothetical protein [Acidobacteriaceae bacterium]